MPINYARSLAGPERTTEANRHLGFALAFVAGAINAGGFLTVQQYTSHMTGIVSSMADNIALGAYELVAGAAAGLLSFVMGAACSAIMINYSRRHRMHSEYALPLLLEACLLLCFGLFGAHHTVLGNLFIPAAIMLLCFIMGLQNAVITKLSKAEIRTTHITGIVTDIGIELGKLMYWNRDATETLPNVVANRARLSVLLFLVVYFFAGGVIGAFGFKHFGHVVTVPLAVVLVVLAGVPVVDDLIILVRRLTRK